MPNYQLGKIYRLVSDQTDQVYIGSTCYKYLSTTLAQHNSNFRLKNKRVGNLSSYNILQHDDCGIILEETFPCNSKDELRKENNIGLITHQIVVIKIGHLITSLNI